MSNSSVIAALSDAEIADFFPGEMRAEFERLVPGYRRIQLPLARPDEWYQLWRNSPGSILVSAWQTPSLNSEILPAAFANWFPAP
ncbi:MAG TPA: hypothetical protein VNN22_14145 [Verrucomicrobiae bacterium]|nr:hypothetical protein [Verrucomicrobiae bacterium]